MGVKMTGRVTARAYAKRDPRFCNSGPIILGKIDSSTSDYPRPFSSYSRVTPRRPCHRRQHSLLSYLKRWITNIWYSIMRRVKGMFSAQVDHGVSLSKSKGKIPSEMESELENAFWREGIQKSDKVRERLVPKIRYDCGLGDHADVYSLYTAHGTLKSPSSDDSDLERWKKSEDSSTGRNNLPGRIDSPLSFDEEYNALYENKTPRPLSGPGRASGKDIEECIALVGDYVARGTKSKKDDDGRVNSRLDSSARCSKRLSSLRTKPRSPSDGKWVQTVCFGSVWYSRSELNNHVPDHRETKNRTRPTTTSRIPRLCPQAKKSFPKN